MSSKCLVSLVVIGLVCCNGDDQVCVTDTSPDGSCGSTGSSRSSEVSDGTSTDSSTGTTVDTTMGSSESTTGDTSGGTTSDMSSSTTIGSAVCGDGMVDEGEECDDSNDEELDGCTTQCEPTPLATALMVAAGAGHTCAVLQGGDVRCWGYGKYGQLGYGNPETIGDDEPPSAAGLVSVGGSGHSAGRRWPSYLRSSYRWERALLG